VVSRESASIPFADTGHATLSAIACATAFPEVLQTRVFLVPSKRKRRLGFCACHQGLDHRAWSERGKFFIGHGAFRSSDCLCLFLSALQTGSSGWRAGGWNNDDVVLELSSVLKANDESLRRHQPPQQRQQRPKPPPMHHLFSRMEFIRATGNGNRAQQLNEVDVDEDPGLESLVADDQYLNSLSNTKAEEERGGWLESDDIEDFE